MARYLHSLVAEMLQAQDAFVADRFNVLLADRAEKGVTALTEFIAQPKQHGDVFDPTSTLYAAACELGKVQAEWWMLDRAKQDTSGVARKVQHCMARIRAVFEGKPDPGSWEDAPFKLAAGIILGATEPAPKPEVTRFDPTKGSPRTRDQMLTVIVIREAEAATSEEDLRERLKKALGIEPPPNASVGPVIGALDRVLSDLLVLAEGPLDEADRQTLKHHADDMEGVAAKVKKLLGAAEVERKVEAPKPPVGPPRCPKCGSTDFLDASQSYDCNRCGHSW